MADKLVGVAVGGAGIREIQAMILRAEELGIHAAWMTTGGARPDSITAFAATAALTDSIKLGTSIVPTYPRHPLVMVQQAQIVAQLAPGRFRLGVGPSHRPTIEAMGIEFNEPLAHLREYLQILKAILQNGRVDFDGDHYTAHDGISEPLDIEIMASALRKGSFELCGEESDGAISWICPGQYLHDVALPAMLQGAQRAGRETPPLIAHAPVCVHDDAEEVPSRSAGAGDEPSPALLPANAGGRWLPRGYRGCLERRHDRRRRHLGRRGEVRRGRPAPLRPGRHRGAGIPHIRRLRRRRVSGPHDAPPRSGCRRSKLAAVIRRGTIVRGAPPCALFLQMSHSPRFRNRKPGGA